MSGRFLTDLADVALATGRVVVEQEGWQTRARSSGGYADGRPTTIMVHHTASNASPASDANYMSYGSADRPLANLMLTRSGEIWVLAAGATNTNGKGGPLGPVPADSMNTHAIGIEACNDGVGEPWPTAQQDAYIALVRTLCARYGCEEVAAHYEWAPTRKIDPAGPSRWGTVNSSGSWDMDAFRAELDDDGGDDMADEKTTKQWVRDVLNEGTGRGLMTWAQTSSETLAVIQAVYNQVLIIQDQLESLGATVEVDET